MKETPLVSIAKTLGIQLESKLQVSGYQIDSRNVTPGDLFFAIQGEKHDGHLFLQNVHAQGAIAAVVSLNYRGPDYGLTLLPVEDVGVSLRFLAKKSLKKSSVQIVGVTGSVGKTTTKDFIATLLEGKFLVSKTIASQNSKLTLPLTVLNRPKNGEILVLEMGMSEPGDMQRLVDIAPPDIAVMTKIALAHAAFFPGGLEEIAREKKEIFSHKTKMAIIDHASNSLLPCAATSFSVVDANATLFLSHNCVYEQGSHVYTLDLPWKASHLKHNFLAAAAVARFLGMEWEEIASKIPLLKLPEMRFEQFEKEGIFFVNDAYNANPESMQSALLNLPQAKGKKIAVLGSMKELGGFSQNCHREMGCFAQGQIDHLLVLGDEAIPLLDAFALSGKPAEYFALDHEKAALRLKEIAVEGDVVLVKGSRSMNMEKVLSCFFGCSII